MRSAWVRSRLLEVLRGEVRKAQNEETGINLDDTNHEEWEGERMPEKKPDEGGSRYVWSVYHILQLKSWNLSLPHIRRHYTVIQ